MIPRQPAASPRTYGPIDTRAERRVTLASDEQTIRRIISDSVLAGRAPIIQLSGDIFLTKTLTLPSSMGGIMLLGAPGLVVRAKIANQDGSTSPAISIQCEAAVSGFTLQAQQQTAAAVVSERGSSRLLDQVIEDIDFQVKDDVAGSGFFETAILVSSTNHMFVRRCNFRTREGINSGIGAQVGGLTMEWCTREDSAAFTPASPFIHTGGLPDIVLNRDMTIRATFGGFGTSPGGRISLNTRCDITLSTGISHVSIVGNTGAHAITSTASAGFNSITANTQATILRHPMDAKGLNT